MSSRAILTARDLAYQYPSGPRALVNVGLDVVHNELVVVIGPNGSGKSTLVKVLAGLITPDAGQIALGDRPLAHLEKSERARHLALVPQFLPAVPEVSVLTFVTGGRYAHRRPGLGASLLGRTLSAADRDAARAALSSCDALEFEERAMTELSGGQRQRVLIARAVAQEAALLLVDEPTNALDPEHQIQVFELVRSLCSRGRAALVVTHDLNLAGQFATRIVLMKEGRVVIDAKSERVLQREVLEPVYGRHLEYLQRAGSTGARTPIIVPYKSDA